MPLPMPTAGESQDAFVARCMGALADEYPDRAQRAAVCHGQWREARPEEDTMQQAKHFSAARPMPGGSGEAGMLVSTESLDYEGDRVFAAGMETNLRNLPLLWAHDRSSIPIGRIVAVDARPGAGVHAAWVWNDADEFGARVKRAWDGGFVRGASIGFLSTERVPNEFGGFDHRTWRLVEVSLTPTPANPDAVRELRALGLLPGADRLVVRVKAETEPVVRVGASLDDVLVRVHAGAVGIVLDDDPEPHGLSLDGAPLTRERARALVVPEVTTALQRTMERAMRRGLASAFCRMTGRVD